MTFAGPAGDIVLVFAPHPDDEAIGCAGVIQRTLAAGGKVRVVSFTNGDGFPAAAAGLVHKPIDQLTADDFFAISRFRQMQMRNALKILGGQVDDLILLGYPDSGLADLYNQTTGKPLLQPFTKKTGTYALIQKDYHTLRYGQAAPYTHAAVLADVIELIKSIQPAEIYVTSGADAHKDHRAASWFVRDAVKSAAYKGAFYTYLVHGLPHHAWPWPEGITPTLPFAAHQVEGVAAPQGLPWPPPRRDPLSPEQAATKLKALRAHEIHPVGNPDHQKNMESFVKCEEVFWLGGGK